MVSVCNFNSDHSLTFQLLSPPSCKTDNVASKDLSWTVIKKGFLFANEWKQDFSSTCWQQHRFLYVWSALLGEFEEFNLGTMHLLIMCSTEICDYVIYVCYTGLTLIDNKYIVYVDCIISSFTKCSRKICRLGVPSTHLPRKYKKCCLNLGSTCSCKKKNIIW